MLADGQNQCVQRHFEAGVRNLVRYLAARRITIALVGHTATFERLEFSVADDQALRFTQFKHIDAFVEQVCDFLTIGRHLVDGAAVDQADSTV